MAGRNHCPGRTRGRTAQAKAKAAASCNRGETAAPTQNNADFQFALGVSLNRVGRVSEEILAYRRAISIQPDHADAIESLGTAYMGQKRYKQAVKAFETLQNYRVNSKSYNLIGLGYFHQEKLDKSVEAFINAINMDAGFDEARYNLGLAYLKKGSPDLARIQYEILQANGSDWADKLLAQIES